MDTKTIGDKTEAKVLSVLIQIYPTVLLPFGQNQRYDLVFEDFDGSLKKVQCKTASIKDGAIQFKSYREIGKGSKRIQVPYSKEEIDFFGVSVPDHSEVYLVPIEKIDHTAGYLRVDPYKKIRNDPKTLWAKDFLLDPTRVQS